MAINDAKHSRVGSAAEFPAGWLMLGLVALAALGLLGIVFDGGIVNLIHRWSSEEQYQHGFLIPLVSAYLLWQRRDAIAHAGVAPSWLGWLLVLAAMLCAILGELSALFLLVQVPIVLALWGLILAAGGKQMLKATFIPILILALAIPLPYFLDAILTWRLQIVSSKLGVWFIRLVDIPVYLEGNVIDLGVYKLQVAEACSGLRYLFPLLSLSFIVAYMFRAPIWQRAIVFLSAIPITIFMNSFRIGVAGVLVNHYGVEAAEGFIHAFEGWIIFMACTAILLGEVWLLNRFTRSAHGWSGLSGDISSGNADKPIASPNKLISTPLIASLATIAVTAVIVLYLPHRPEIIPKHPPLASFPQQMNGWHARFDPVDAGTKSALKADDTLLADFTKSGTLPVNLFIAYYGSQRTGASPHSPRVCIPGGGWEITDLHQTTVPVDGRKMPVISAVIERQGVRQLVFYWYLERGQPMADEFYKKWHLLVDSIVKNRSDGALVRLVTPIPEGETDAAARQRLLTFMAPLNIQLARFIPK
ncbi:MAG TPA: VPLPA-CTERM-specific exosortase XrtD [Alphaproteobacteria bacterium]|nr:VPLPA-CTERM-specific exosortase XrtD [Alphaproteobacteria bacterium]